MQGYIFVLLTVVTIVYADQCVNIPNGESVPHEKNCSQFYICNFNKPVLKSCAFNLHFNPIKKYCQSKASAGCDDTETTPPIPETTTPKPETTTPKPETTTPKPETTTPKPLPTPSPLACRHQKLGQNIPFEGDCTKYITCIGINGVTRTCESGTHFNIKMGVCDWPQRAKCPWW